MNNLVMRALILIIEHKLLVGWGGGGGGGGQEGVNYIIMKYIILRTGIDLKLLFLVKMVILG